MRNAIVPLALILLPEYSNLDKQPDSVDILPADVGNSQWSANPAVSDVSAGSKGQRRLRLCVVFSSMGSHLLDSWMAGASSFLHHSRFLMIASYLRGLRQLCAHVQQWKSVIELNQENFLLEIRNP